MTLSTTGRTVGDPMAGFRDDLLEWHAAQPQVMEWRDGTADPWTVLVCELCLRRATTRHVRPVLDRLRSGSLSPSAIAADPARARAVLDAVGLRHRSQLIIDIATSLVELHEGQVPGTELELSALPGVGEYLVQAVRTFAYDEAAVLLDRSSARVMTRLNGHDDDRRWQVRLDLFRLAGGIGPERDFNGALLELARSICRPERPLCGECPVRVYCRTGQNASNDSLFDAIASA
jgi:A/G-specific adenine glycosylase